VSDTNAPLDIVYLMRVIVVGPKPFTGVFLRVFVTSCRVF